MNELHRVIPQTVRVGEKDINLTIEEEYSPENPTQVVRIKIVGPNGLQSNSMEGMMKLLGVAPRYLLSEEDARGSEAPSSPASAASGAASNKLLPSGNGDQLPEAGPLGIVEDAFDSIGGSSGPEDLQVATKEPGATESGPPTGNGSQSRHVHGAMNVPPSIFDRTNDDLGDLTLDVRNGREHSLRAQKFEREHPYLWKDYDDSVDNDEGERSSIIEDMTLVWWCELTKFMYPELYAAALDPKKYVEYMDKYDYWTGERPKFEDLAETVDSICPNAARCQFIKADGTQCGSAALKRRRLCYFHSKTSEERKSSKARRGDTRGGTGEVNGADASLGSNLRSDEWKKKKTVGRELPAMEAPVLGLPALELPVLEDDLAIQMAVTNICRQVAHGTIEPKRATTLLYGLQVASVTVRRSVLNGRQHKA